VPGDIVYGRRGDIGRQALIRQPQAGWLCGTGCLRLSLGDSVIEPLFLHYYLRQADVIGWIANQAVGATLPNLNTGILRSVPVRLPSLLAQRKIAAILSAYDDLIENNLRRIKILEEMAQNLYREWFVKFRFPGHQHARFTDSPLGKIPEGWDLSVLGEHLVALESGKRPKGGAKDLAFGVPSVGAENIFGIGRHKYHSEKYVSRDFFEGMRQGIVKNADVALYKDGAYIGRSTYFRDSFPHAQFCVNEHVFLLRSTGKQLTQNMLYLWLQEPATVAAFRATNANAAQPGINQTGVNGVSLIVPPLDIAGRFDQLAEPSLALIVSLAKRNETLRRNRDLLLSRLISGELNVSELDIAVPEEASA
jgi:type I restriction enzyme S subunit